MPLDHDTATLLEQAGVPFQVGLRRTTATTVPRTLTDATDAHKSPALQVVLTKTDKVSPNQLEQLRTATSAHIAAARWRHARRDVVTVSAHARAGLDELRTLLYAASMTPPPSAAANGGG